ncbi:MAG: preprotein translocase subunit YajC [Chitinispirillales bacterium]|jgi:preprotein translocase subunit YajC|nr:preprotein translocase subunit YajC [Chitinispirillales bacterium]
MLQSPAKCLLFIATIALTALPVIAQEDGGGAPPPGINFFFIMIAMIAIIYFVMIRPEKKRQKERQNMLTALKKGDKIITIGGIVGVITAVKDTTYVIKSGGDGAVLEFTKSAIQNLVTDNKAADTQAGDGK